MADSNHQQHNSNLANNSCNNQEETLLDEAGWKEEAQGVIGDVIDYVKLIEVADNLKVSQTNE